MHLEMYYSKYISYTVWVLVFLYYQMNRWLNRKTVWIKKKKYKNIGLFPSNSSAKIT